MIFIWGLWLWSKGSSFMGFLVKKKVFWSFKGFVFLLTYDFRLGFIVVE